MQSIKHPIVFFSIFVFGALLASPFPASAAVGDNCRTNLTSGIPDSQDWKGVYIIRGDDGSAWQRGIISNPIDTLLIKEGQATDITATVGANAATAFFIYAADESDSGVIRKPGEGVCFEGPRGDAAGGVAFPVNARAVWGSLGRKLVVDVFYRMEEGWDQLYGQKTNSNFLMGTFMLPKIVSVNLDVPPASGSSAVTQPARGKWEEARAKAPQAKSGTGAEQQAVGFECLASTDSKGLPAAIYSRPNMYYRLDPVNITPRLLGDNFDGVGGNPVEILRQNEYLHTHFARLATNTSSGNFDKEELTRIAIQSKILEHLKRILEGTFTGSGSFCRTDLLTYKIGDLTPDNLTNNADKNDMVKAVKTLLTDSGDRNAAAKAINDLYLRTTGMNVLICTENQKSTDFVPQYFLKSLPATSSEDSWAEDFLNILLFWTGSSTSNICVMRQDDFAVYNYIDSQGVRLSLSELNDSVWTYVAGVTPIILLNTRDPITLTPTFEDTKIVYAEKEFTDSKGWALPAGKKQPLYYRYDFTNPFPKDRAGEMCVKQTNLADLVASVEKAYQLTPEETATLSRELTAEFPSTEVFVKLSLANPADIAARFSWQGDGKPLSLLQLFFEFTPGGCAVELLVPPALNIPSDRDGFEVGILE